MSAKDNRKSASDRGYNYRWVNYRRVFLRNNPLCVYCEKVGRITAASVVDHIMPHKGNQELFWDCSNHQALCKHCHDSIKAREERGSLVPGCDESGFPTNAGHHWKA